MNKNFHHALMKNPESAERIVSELFEHCHSKEQQASSSSESDS